MKKKLLLLICSVIAMKSFASDAKVDGICYDLNITQATAEVVSPTNYSPYSGNISIPSSITYDNREYAVIAIGDCAFEGANLSSISIPSSVTRIGESAFKFCSLPTISIPNIVTNIGKRAFEFCSLSTISIPNSVTFIAEETFAYSENLSSVTLSNSTSMIYIGAFHGCTSLTSISIPNTVEYIYESAFQDCSSLKSISLPNSITLIGEFAFMGCSNLSSIEIPNSITTLNDYTFKNCTKLTTIKLPTQLQSIGMYAFMGCSSLKSIVIPETVGVIEGGAFEDCKNLQSVTIKSSIPPSVSNDAFRNIPNTLTIYVPCAGVQAYKKHEYLKQFKIQSYEQGCEGDEEYYSISLTPNPVLSGTTEGSGNYAEGSTVTCVAKPYSGAVFKYWSETDIYGKDKVVSYSNPYVFTANKENCMLYPTVQDGRVGYRFLTANFEAKSSDSFTISVSVPNSWSSHSSKVSIWIWEDGKDGSMQDMKWNSDTKMWEFEAKNMSSINFVILSGTNWSSDQYQTPDVSHVSETTCYEIANSVGGAKCKITAVECVQSKLYVISVSCNSTMGTVSGSGTYMEGQSVTCTATPRQGYKFKSWSNGVTQNPYTFTAKEDLTLVANFEKQDTPSSPISIYATIPNTWTSHSSKVSIWTWLDNVDGAMHSMTWNSNKQAWQYETTEPYINFVILSGTNWSTEQYQTPDISHVTETTCYNIAQSVGGAKCKITEVDCEPTALQDIHTQKSTSIQKVLIDGDLYILKDGQIFNIMGY